MYNTLQLSNLSASSSQSAGEVSVSSMPPGEPSMKPGVLGVERREGGGGRGGGWDVWRGGRRVGEEGGREGWWKEGSRHGLVEGGGGGSCGVVKGRGGRMLYVRPHTQHHARSNPLSPSHTVSLFYPPSPPPLSGGKSEDCIHSTRRRSAVSKPRPGHPSPPTAG